MERKKTGFWNRIKPIIEHTIVLLLILVSIWIIRQALERLFNKDPMLFKVVPIEYVTDFADLLALIKYLLALIKEFGGKI